MKSLVGNSGSGIKKAAVAIELRLRVSANCHYCGIEPQERKSGLVVNGIDRVDNTRGYHVDNVVPCCMRCNHAKHISSYEDFTNWIMRIKAFAGVYSEKAWPVFLRTYRKAAAWDCGIFAPSRA